MTDVTDTTPPGDHGKTRRILAGLNIDFPSVLAINIFVTFALVILCNAVFKVAIDADLKQVLITIVTLMVGFYFGSSAGSKEANQTVKQLALSPLPVATNGIVAAPPAVVTPATPKPSP